MCVNGDMEPLGVILQLEVILARFFEPCEDRGIANTRHVHDKNESAIGTGVQPGRRAGVATSLPPCCRFAARG